MAKQPFDWKTIIYRGIESEELDYKAAQDWGKLDRVGKSKFVRHCLAMANTRGGYIVVGVGEDKSGRPCLDTGVTEKQSKSFDPTAVGSFINRYADPAIDFDIERPTIDGKRFVIIVIRKFSTLPHVCSYNCNSELQQGVFYIRTADASSRPAFRSSEIHGIIQSALRNQRQILGRMLRGILYENRQNFEEDAHGYFSEQVKNSSELFFARAPMGEGENVFLEITVFPENFEKEKFGLSELHNAGEYAISAYGDSPFLVAADVEESFNTNVSLRSLREERMKFWQAFQSGLFHYIFYLEKGGNAIDYSWLVEMVSAAVYFLGQFYLELGNDDELLSVRFKLTGVEGVKLKGVDAAVVRKGNKKNQYVCQIPSVKVTMQRTVADLASGVTDHAIRIVKEICERFNLPDGKHQNLESVIKELQESRNI